MLLNQQSIVTLLILFLDLNLVVKRQNYLKNGVAGNILKALQTRLVLQLICNKSKILHTFQLKGLAPVGECLMYVHAQGVMVKIKSINKDFKIMNSQIEYFNSGMKKSTGNLMEMRQIFSSQSPLGQSKYYSILGLQNLDKKMINSIFIF